MKTFDILIKNCHVLNPDLTILPNATIGIENGRIVMIQTHNTSKEAPTAKDVLDGSGKLAIPGFVDGHTHATQQLLRGSVVDELPMVWTRILVPFESNLTPDDVYKGAKLFCIENLKAGTTTFADAGGPYMESVARAAEEIGIRGVISRSTMDCGELIPDAMKERTKDAIKHTEQLYKDWNGAGDGRIQIWFGLRQAMTSTPELMEAVSEQSKTYQTGVHIHLAEHLAEVAHCLTNYKMRPAEWFDSFGLLGPNLIAAHSVRLSDKEIILMSERKANAVHCPHSNLGNHGFSKTPLMMALGVNIGLGTDGVAGTRLNLFEPMRLLKFAVQARFGIDINDPVALPALETLKMATQGGARAVMMEDEIGKLAVGMKADIILLDINKPHLSPTAHLPKTIATVAGPDDVTDVIVDGHLIIKNNTFVHIDEEKIRHEAGEAMLAVGKKADLSLESPYVN
jgi:5-methylthioadenosine/S-adenosylhomocysteine deaminase